MSFPDWLFTAGRRVLPIVLLCSVALPVAAQQRLVDEQEEQDLINWYYAATFGTGVYTSGDRTVAVLQVPFSHELRPVSEENWGLRLKMPVTLGFYNYAFDDVFEGEFPEQLSTISVMPGLEWNVPLTGRLTLRPYISGGYGQEINGSESALIYDFGLKSRYRLGEDKGVEFALVNSLTAAGYRPREGPSQPFGVFVIGVDLVIPTNIELFGRDAYIGFTPMYYFYFNHLKFPEFDDADNRLREQFELAISVMTHHPWSLRLFEIDRVGLAIRSSDEVFGISLFTSLPF